MNCTALTGRRTGRVAVWLSLVFGSLGLVLFSMLFYAKVRHDPAHRRPATVAVATSPSRNDSSGRQRPLEEAPPPVERQVSGLQFEPPLPPVEPVHRKPPGQAPAQAPATPGPFPLPPTNANPTTSDDLASWRELDVLALSNKNVPEWVLDAGGSEPWSQTAFGRKLDARRPGSRKQLVGYSTNFEPSQQAARDLAIASASKQLQANTLWTAQELLDRSPRVGSRPAPSFSQVTTVIQRRIAADLGQCVQSWYDESVDLRGDKVYRSAVLVRASPEQLSDVAVDALSTGLYEALDQRRRVIGTAVGLLAITIAIMLAYSILNAITRGYFAWPLRMLSAVALVALYISLFYWKGWWPG